jgi:hypothetical protein
LLRFPEAQQAVRRDLTDNVRRNIMTAPNPSEDFRKITESKDLDRATAKIFLDLLKSSQVTIKLLKMTWEVIKLKTPKHTFLTSDRPIIKRELCSD